MLTHGFAASDTVQEKCRDQGAYSESKIDASPSYERGTPR